MTSRPIKFDIVKGREMYKAFTGTLFNLSGVFYWMTLTTDGFVRRVDTSDLTTWFVRLEEIGKGAVAVGVPKPVGYVAQYDITED